MKTNTLLQGPLGRRRHGNDSRRRAYGVSRHRDQRVSEVKGSSTGAPSTVNELSKGLTGFQVRTKRQLVSVQYRVHRVPCAV